MCTPQGTYILTYMHTCIHRNKLEPGDLASIYSCLRAVIATVKRFSTKRRAQHDGNNARIVRVQCSYSTE